MRKFTVSKRVSLLKKTIATIAIGVDSVIAATLHVRQLTIKVGVTAF